jgi:hypothetical protein
MHAFAAAGAGFLLAVLWFDLMFDVHLAKLEMTAIFRGSAARVKRFHIEEDVRNATNTNGRGH